ncbi:MAG: hypothetical protein NTX79_06430 [Candidatus Micrarchaeota archaeon]|nr:hypothetical protein [Candidatus Micrarchaeota archaeon]
MDAVLERQMQKDWDATCRVLFGAEMGKLHDFLPWLSYYAPPSSKRKSHVSGKEVALATDRYPKNARFVSADEVEHNCSYALSMNDIKDIDSLRRALLEKCEYSGNRLLGNTAFADSSDLITDSQYIYSSNQIQNCSHACASTLIRRGCKYAFGCVWHGECEFTLRVAGAYNVKRCFESFMVTDSTGLAFCHACLNCHDLMFCFGQQNAGYRIGNIQLEKTRYALLKAKLMSEIVERLAEEKAFPSLFELVPDTLPKSIPKISVKEEKDVQNVDIVRKGFASTYGIIFKKPPKHKLEEYADWLEQGAVRAIAIKTPYGRESYIPENFSMYSMMPRSRLVSVPEIMEIGKHEMPSSCLEGLEGMFAAMKDSFFFTGEFYSGKSRNAATTPCVFNAVNTYKGFDATNAENTAYATLALNSKYTYGGNWTLESEFCIKCYNSNFLARCLEMDGCTKCADSYFCHNCEGLTDCMFCFNMKGARHCIANTQLSREEYIKARDAILAKLSDELDSTRGLKMSIYNIGAKG